MTDAVDKGLAQMDDQGLQNVISHVDAGHPLCLTGAFSVGTGLKDFYTRYG